MVNTEIRLIIFFAAKDGEALYSQKKTKQNKTRSGADCGSDHELLIAKFRLKLKKVGKTTRPFRYDLNQIAYDYTVEVRNRFKGLDLIDRVPDWFQIRKGVHQGCILSPCLFNLYAEYIMINAVLEEGQAGIKIARKNNNNLRYADDITLTAETKKPLDESERGE